MNTEKEYQDITNRQGDLEIITKATSRAEIGLRAIASMYDDHSADRNSLENIQLLKDNIKYRLFSASHQYLVFLRELYIAENNLQDVYKKNPHYLTAFPLGNPFFEKTEEELSSIFDNIIFQVSSVFDYLAHVICYIVPNNKSNTLYWTKLAKAARDQGNQLLSENMKFAVDTVDKRFVGRLYDYRSRLLHNKRDQHKFNGTIVPKDFTFHLRFIPSEIVLKHFKIINDEVGDNKQVTLTFSGILVNKKNLDRN